MNEAREVPGALLPVADDNRYTTGRMRRFPVLVYVIVSLLWQAAAIAVPMGLVGDEDAATHAVLHWQESGHHHHDGDDSGFHEDDSSDSRQHTVLDDGLSSPALYSTPAPSVESRGSAAPAVLDDPLAPPPYVDKRRRPPRQIL
ncbi:MAG: hypothetical protein LT106_02955 [Burkholderiaceae bacterium]|nr:hypothetical protein [Burkholderiaceae bacterium]